MADSSRCASGAGSGAGGRARLPVLAALLRRRSHRDWSHAPTRAQELSGRRRDAAALSLARGRHLPAGQAEVRIQHLLWRQPENPPGCFDGGGQRGTSADPGGLRQAHIGALSGLVPGEPAQHHRDVRAADGPQALPASRRRDIASARRLRQRVDPAARPRRASPAGALGACGPWRGAGSHRATAVDRGTGDRRGRGSVGRLDRVEGVGVDRRVGADQLVRRRVGDRDESAGPLVQHRAGAGDRDCVRRLAGAAAVAARPRARGTGQRPTRDRQCAGAADSSRHGCGPGRVDDPDVDRRCRGGEGVHAPGERRPRIQPGEHHVAADPRSRR